MCGGVVRLGQFPDAKNGSSNRPERAVWACPLRRATATSHSEREPKTHREPKQQDGTGMMAKAAQREKTSGHIYPPLLHRRPDDGYGKARANAKT
ncbi:hypothetical protein NQZ68_022557 [Dissostichus eleginoides]|nr:hypothetical protein NQZ68_022557 [Dissostichus eleginoides]